MKAKKVEVTITLTNNRRHYVTILRDGAWLSHDTLTTEEAHDAAKMIDAISAALYDNDFIETSDDED